ncbi:hypothetical protein [Bacillus pretiosus]|uniref:hypothetical protein n=1 Tax=Bacillus pretiosus TaxID=2983392 RepID=UPI002EDABB5E
MIFWILKGKKYKKIYIMLRNIEKKVNYKKKITIYVDYSDKKLSNWVMSEKSICIGKNVIKLYPESPVVLKSLLAHKFAHIINGYLRR